MSNHWGQREEKKSNVQNFLTLRNPQNQAQGGNAVCHDWMGVMRGRQDKRHGRLNGEWCINTI